MRKRNGWCIWSPWSGYLSSTFACTRTECIKLFERESDTTWRRYREQGFECRPVLFVDARKKQADAITMVRSQLARLRDAVQAANANANMNEQIAAAISRATGQEG